MQTPLATSLPPNAALRNGYGFLLGACAASGLGSFFSEVPTVPAWLLAGACATTFAWRLAPLSPHFRRAGALWFLGTLGSLASLFFESAPNVALVTWLVIETWALWLLLLGIRDHARLLGAPHLEARAGWTRPIVLLTGLAFAVDALFAPAAGALWWWLTAHGLLLLALGQLAAQAVRLRQLLGGRSRAPDAAE